MKFDEIYRPNYYGKLQLYIKNRFNLILMFFIDNFGILSIYKFELIDESKYN